MHGTISTKAARSNSARSGSWPKKTEPPPLAFGDLARFAFPLKTIESLGAAAERATGEIPGRSTIKAWLNGTHTAPGWMLAIVTAEIMRRYQQRISE